MAKMLDPQTSAAVRAQLRFYRELGVYDVYKREVPEELLARLSANESASETPSDEAAPDVQKQTVAVATEELGEVMAKRRSAAASVAIDKPAALKVIREDIGDCTRCVLHKQGRKQIVFGVGNVNAEIMFVGEGPGADEDEQGEPFVGRAGQLLNNMINAMGIKREDVYIANVVKCRPPQNRTPERDECDTCSPFLLRQIAVVRPKVVVALGAVAAKNLLGVNDAMANLRGKFYDFKPIVPKNSPEAEGDFTTKLAVTYHPAYLLRDPRQKAEAWKDLKMVMAHLGMPLPASPAK